VSPAHPKYQKYGTVRITNVRPKQVTEQQLSSGFWSLSTLSTVPYVRLTGPGGFQKLFSWNEIVEVPAGTDAFIENASAHQGDIVINGGTDFGALPARVTVPVPLVDKATQLPITQDPVAPTFIVPLWRCDTRRARRAFLVFGFVTGDNGNGFAVRGFAQTRSHRTQNSMDAASSGVGFSTGYIIPAATQVSIIPLGHQALNGLPPGEPHALLDAGEVEFLFTPGQNETFTNLSAYYVLEYA
jgi:hypothetical protein